MLLPDKRIKHVIYWVGFNPFQESFRRQHNNDFHRRHLLLYISITINTRAPYPEQESLVLITNSQYVYRSLVRYQGPHCSASACLVFHQTASFLLE